MKTDALVIGEEEQLVFDDAAADAPAELIVGERVLSLGRVFEEIPGIELLVAVVLIGGAMEDVRAALAYSDKDGAARFAVFRRHAVLFDTELLNRIHRWAHCLSAKDGCRNRAAVEYIVVVARPASADPQVAVIAAEFAAGLLRHARGQRKQAVDVPASHTGGRQLLQLPFVDSLAKVRLLCLQQRRTLGGDLNLLRNLPDLKCQIDLWICVHLKRNVLYDRCLEAFRLGFHVVYARIQAGRDVDARTVRCQGCDSVCAQVYDPYSCARNYGSARIADTPADCSEQPLRQHIR